MSAPERQQQTVPDTRRKEQDEEALPAYHQAACFHDEQSSQVSYDQAQQTIYEAPCNLATYRLLLMPDNLWHVVVLGECPAEEVHQRLTDTLSTGELVSVPNDLLIALNTHRRAQPTQNSWAEQHNLPFKLAIPSPPLP
jgi:hypothetical protein